jgi:threonyl-tRNA synthetase
VLPISDEQAGAAEAVVERLRAAGIRAVADAGNATLNYRIREGEVGKVPYMAVVGQREAEAGTVAVRIRGAGNKQEVMPVDDFVARVTGKIRTRALEM